MAESERCEFCREEFSHTTVKEYENWELQLFTNQYYLGRCLIKLNRHIVDLCNLKEEERAELFEKILPALKQAVDHLFDPDIYNYASLGNDCRHFHMHFIPRYGSPREFDGIKFKDENWNSHYKPYPKDFEIPEKTYKKLKKEVEDFL